MQGRVYGIHSISVSAKDESEQDRMSPPTIAPFVISAQRGRRRLLPATTPLASRTPSQNLLGGAGRVWVREVFDLRIGGGGVGVYFCFCGRVRGCDC